MMKPNLTEDARRMVLYSAGFSTLWFGLAWINPSTTYHLAPLIIPLVPVGMSFSLEQVRGVTWGAPSLMAAGLAVGTTGLLSLLNKLSGPSLLPFGGAVVEALVLSAMGLAIALAAARVRRLASARS